MNEPGYAMWTTSKPAPGRYAIRLPRDITTKEAEDVADAFMRWQNDPSRPLMLGHDFELVDLTPQAVLSEPITVDGAPWWMSSVYFGFGVVSTVVGVLIGAVVL